MGVFFPAIKAGSDAKMLCLSIHFPKRSIKQFQPLRAHRHHPHKLFYLPVITSNKSTTPATAHLIRVGENHDSGNSTGQRILEFIRCGWPHLELIQEWVLQPHHLWQNYNNRAPLVGQVHSIILDQRFTVYFFFTRRFLRSTGEINYLSRLQTVITLRRLRRSRNLDNFFSALLITFVIFTSSTAPTTVPQATHWIRQNFCPTFVVTGTASNSWYSHDGHFDLAIDAPLTGIE